MVRPFFFSWSKGAARSKPPPSSFWNRHRTDEKTALLWNIFLNLMFLTAKNTIFWRKFFRKAVFVLALIITFFPRKMDPYAQVCYLGTPFTINTTAKSFLPIWSSASFNVSKSSVSSFRSCDLNLRTIALFPIQIDRLYTICQQVFNKPILSRCHAARPPIHHIMEHNTHFKTLCHLQRPTLIYLYIQID